MKVNEIFYSLQGEGCHSGRAAVFVRLSGCNLKCPFCDTSHQSGKEMSVADIVAAVTAYPATLVVVTGGEPSLQLTDELVDALHQAGRYVAVETNGTRPLSSNVDWVTLSPKDLFCDNASVVLRRANELKLVFDGIHEPDMYDGVEITGDYLLQPCDTGDADRNRAIVSETVAYIKRHPRWRMSLQIHKIIGIE